MRKLLTTVAMLTAMASPALAEVDGNAYGAALAIVYDSGCAKLPPDLMYEIARQSQAMPDAVFGPATAKVHDQLVKLGPTEFCSRAKQLVDKALRGQ